jgi:hypothetical protein
VVERRAGLVAGLAVLHAWDARRARAWALSDAHGLRALYVRGSRAGQADVRLLRAYTARRLVVRRLVTQVLEVRVLERTPHTMTLRVVDLVAGGVVTRDDRARALGTTRPVRRTIVFRHADGRWQVESVSGSGRAPRAGPR